MGSRDRDLHRAAGSLPEPEDLEELEKLVANIEDYLADALALLSEQDRTLLVAHYSLEDASLLDASEPPELHTEEARRLALRRARLRFNRTLESVLAGAAQHEPTDRPGVQEALALLRGGARKPRRHSSVVARAR